MLQNDGRDQNHFRLIIPKDSDIPKRQSVFSLHDSQVNNYTSFSSIKKDFISLQKKSTY
jgi:hypothetical protein